jgi:hypothetical protein
MQFESGGMPLIFKFIFISQRSDGVFIEMAIIMPAFMNIETLPLFAFGKSPATVRAIKRGRAD